MSNSVLVKTAGTGTADNSTIFELLSNAELFDTWQLGSTAGSMDVYVSGDGTNFLTAALAMVDLGSTAPSTAVVATTAGGHYGIRGRWKAIRVLQVGGTNVANGYLIGYNT
jgi:hypothetical protein